MYFLSRSNKYYALMIGTRSAYRYIALLSVIGALVFVWFSFIYIPVSNSLNYYSHQLMLINTQQIAYATMKKNYKQIAKANTQLQITYNRLVKRHLSNQTTEATIPFNYAVQAGANLHQYTQGTEKELEWGKKHTVSLSLSASLERLTYFIALMHSATQMHMTHTFSFTSDNENSFLLQSTFKNIQLKKDKKSPSTYKS